MSTKREPRDTEVEFYEGLIFTTTCRIQGVVKEEFEDIQQIFRMKVVMALRAFESTRSSMSRKAFVFACLMNQKKDLLKRVKRDVVSIESFMPNSHPDLFSSNFEARYLSIDDAFAEVEREVPLIPSTLRASERHLLVLLYAGRKTMEIRRELGVNRMGLEQLTESLRIKMADWRPTEPSNDPERARLAA